MNNTAIKNDREEKESLLKIAGKNPDPTHIKKQKIQKSKNAMIEEYLADHYKFRYNTLKNRTEWLSSETKEYIPVDKYFLNSIRRELDSVGHSTNIDNINSIITSDFAKRVNPIQEYFNSLPKANTDYLQHINRLIKTVETDNPEIWANYFTKWLVAVVANAMNNDGCQNHTCLVLTGGQGLFKTTWLNYLCPKTLSRYLYTGKIDPQNKDTLTYISEYLFVNIDDQLKELNKKDENALKALITAPFVKYRRAYGTYIEEYPHLASFMASINGNEFLTDPTGSRRFLPFHVKNIDLEAQKSINMNQVYAEAMSLYREGFRYWFNAEEINQLNEYSQEFQLQTNEFEIIASRFREPESNEDFHMTTTEVMSHIKAVSNINVSTKRVGEALKKLGYTKLSKRVNGKSIYVYLITTI